MSRQASGLRAWVLQRVTAVYLGIYIIYLFTYLAFSGPDSYETWRAYLAHPVAAAAMQLFFVALLIHSWVGIRDVLIDYVPLFIARVVLLTLFGTGLVACGLFIARTLFLA
ncbi:MAG: succinate dehydrogenase, hydrophobic membrane anchor protein [Candidatus Sedimenticola sp. (ex Thyasira tokunagai)]